MDTEAAIDKEKIAFKCKTVGQEEAMHEHSNGKSPADDPVVGLSRTRAESARGSNRKLRVKSASGASSSNLDLEKGAEIKTKEVKDSEVPKNAKSAKSGKYAKEVKEVKRDDGAKDRSDDADRRGWSWSDIKNFGNEEPGQLTHDKRVKYFLVGSIPAIIILFAFFGALIYDFSDNMGPVEGDEQWVELGGLPDPNSAKNSPNAANLTGEMDGNEINENHGNQFFEIVDKPLIQESNSSLNDETQASNDTQSNVNPETEGAPMLHDQRWAPPNDIHSNDIPMNDPAQLKIALFGFDFEAAKIPNLPQDPQFYFVVSFVRAETGARGFVLKTEPAPPGYKALGEQLPAIQTILQGLELEDIIVIKAKYDEDHDAKKPVVYAAVSKTLKDWILDDMRYGSDQEMGHRVVMDKSANSVEGDKFIQIQIAPVS